MKSSADRENNKRPYSPSTLQELASHTKYQRTLPVDIPTGELHANSKGKLLELFQKMKNEGKVSKDMKWDSYTEISPTGASGFRCELTLFFVVGDPITCQGEWASKKKDAEQSAAAAMLARL